MSYYVLEGIDGSGKDSQADRLVVHLESQGRNVLRINEPDDTMPIGKLLRSMLREGTFVKAHAALFLADRIALMTEKIIPHLNEGGDVVSSRSFLSTLVYQQENWSREWLLDIHRELPVKPTHLFVLDLPAETALERCRRRPGPNEYYEKLDIQIRNKQRYLDLDWSILYKFIAPQGVVATIDASGTQDEVFGRIKELL